MELKTFPKIGEKLFIKTLPNGLSVQVLSKPGYNKSYAFFATNYGGADRRFKYGGNWTDTPAGVAHFLEHKMFDTPDGGNALAKLSANGASPNAFTSAAMTAYFFDCAGGFEKNLETLLQFVSVPYFTAESVAKEQGIIGQEIRMIEDHPGHMVYYNLMRSLYAENPVRDSVGGTIESIAEITAETLYACHRVFYNPSNMILCAAGDIDPESVADAALAILPEQPGEIPERDYGKPEVSAPLETSTVKTMEVSAPLFVIGSKLNAGAAGSGRLRQKLLGDLALACLFGRSSAFYARLYADGLLNNDFSTEIDYAAGTATFMADGESREPERVLAEIAGELTAVSERGLNEALFTRLKKAYFGGMLRGLGQFDHQCRALADGHFNGYCPLDAFDILAELDAAQTEHFIRENLRPEHLSISVIKPKGGGAR